MEELAVRIEQFLEAHHVMSLATAGESGAHVVSLMYARIGFALCWMSDPATSHSRHLEREPRVSATIAPDYADFRAIRGLQIAGRAARIAAASEADEARELLERRYAFLAGIAAGPPQLREAFDRASFYRLEPERITLIDNSRGFGHKETLTLAP